MDKKQKDTLDSTGIPADSGTESNSADRTRIAPDNILQEFERLVERMQSPEHAEAWQRLTEMTSEDLHDFFQKPPGSRKFDFRQKPRVGVQFIPLARAAELSYPCIAVASLNHFETGLGHLRGLLVVSVSSAKELHDEIVRTWSEYHVQGVEIRLWSESIEDSELLSLAPVRKVLRSDVLRPSALRYVTSIHVGYA